MHYFVWHNDVTLVDFRCPRKTGDMLLRKCKDELMYNDNNVIIMTATIVRKAQIDLCSSASPSTHTHTHTLFWSVIFASYLASLVVVFSFPSNVRKWLSLVAPFLFTFLHLSCRDKGISVLKIFLIHALNQRVSHLSPLKERPS